MTEPNGAPKGVQKPAAMAPAPANDARAVLETGSTTR